METLWFYIVAVMVAVYVVLDGFDLGTGVLHLFVARNDDERRTVLQSIGPVWDGNEVWLLAAGGAMVLAFPRLYATGFSGFYLPLMMVLWLLILRAISIEFRSHLEGSIWRPFWDVVFFFSSLLLAVFLGAALGNVVRGVPMGEDGYFFTPLWTSFGIHDTELGILDWYTVSVGVTSLLALTYHGAMWVILKTEGAIRDRTRSAARFVWPLLVLFVALVTVFTFSIQAQVPARMNANPLSYLLPLAAAVCLVGSRVYMGRARELPAFLGSALFLALMLVSVVFGLYPMVLPGGWGPRRFVDDLQCGGPPLRPLGRASLVDPRDDPGGDVHDVRVQEHGGEGQTGSRGILTQAGRRSPSPSGDRLSPLHLPETEVSAGPLLRQVDDLSRVHGEVLNDMIECFQYRHLHSLDLPFGGEHRHGEGRKNRIDLGKRVFQDADQLLT